METLFIADDEAVIREGLRHLIDWEALGFTICGEAGNGEDALHGILTLRPTITLIDIRMPKLTGLSVIEQAIAQGYSGKFIIISGFSDFEYAKTAMKLGVQDYLTKPIDEEELTKTVTDISETIQSERAAQLHNDLLLLKSKPEILQDILKNSVDFYQLQLNELGLMAEIYQVVVYESFDPDACELPYQFSDLFKVAASGSSGSFEHFEYQHNHVLLLKGSLAIERFQRFLKHYDTSQPPQKGSPLDTLFIAYGCPIRTLKDLSISYEQAAALLNRRFFCIQGQHILSFEDLPSVQKSLRPLDQTRISSYADTITDYLQTFNRRKVAEELYSMEEYLYQVDAEIDTVKLFLIDIYLKIKETMTYRYNTIAIPFASNAEVIAEISGKHYLYEIITYFSSRFEAVMNAIGNSSRDSVLDDILYYIDHNYHTNLKLETIASLFGYNSSYLGKIFNKTVGESFNSYVDQVRIRHAIRLLTENKYKVYEIAEQVGYKNVDYFHKKFKKYVGESPAEYRKALDSSAADQQ